MSLSDTLFGALGDLIDGFHTYLDWEQGPKLWDEYLSAVRQLATVTYTIDRGDSFIDEHGISHPWKKSHRLCAECFFVERLLASPGTSTPNGMALSFLTQIAKTNTSLNDAIHNAYHWRNSLAGLAEVPRRDDVVPIEPRYERISALTPGHSTEQ